MHDVGIDDGRKSSSMAKVRGRGRSSNRCSDWPGLSGVGQHEAAIFLLPEKVPDVRLGLAGKTGPVITHHPAIENAFLRKSERSILQEFLDLIGKTQTDPFFFLQCADDLERGVVHLNVGPIVAEADEIPSIRSPLQAPMPRPHDARVFDQHAVVPEPSLRVEADATAHPGMADRFAHVPMVPRLGGSCRKCLGAPRQSRGKPRASLRSMSRARWAAALRTALRPKRRRLCTTWVRPPAAGEVAHAA